MNNKNIKTHIELLRIIASFFVIFNHIGSWGFTLFLNFNSNDIRYWFYMFVSVLCKISVPIFFMISGALLLEVKNEPKHKNVRRIGKIITSLIIFSMLSYIQTTISTKEFFSFKEFLHTFISNTWMPPFWYLYTYIGFLITLNIQRKLAHALDNKDFMYIVMIVFIINGFLPVFLYIASNGKLQINNNFNITWVSTQANFYPLIGYYLENRIDYNKINIRKYLLLWLANFVCIVLTCYATFLNNKINDSFPQTFMMNLVMVNAISVFVTAHLLTNKMQMSFRTKRIINSIGSCTFGIYLVNGILLREPVIGKIVKNVEFLGKFPLTKGLLYSLEIMLISFVITWILKKIPYINRII